MWAVIILAAVLILLTASYLWKLLNPSDVVEIRARILPLGWKRCVLADLDGDGNDEVVVETNVEGWMNLLKARPRVSTAVTMRNGKFLTFPTPLSELRTARPRGRRLVGRTEKGDLAVAELMPNGKWSVQVLLPKMPRSFKLGIGDLDGSGQDDDVIVLSGTNNERVLWFKRQDDGRWVKGGEIVLPTNKQQEYSCEIKPYGALVWVYMPPGAGAYSISSQPLFFLDGRWEIGKLGEGADSFELDLDGDGRKERMLVRFLNEKVRWQIWLARSNRKLDGEWNFKGWSVKDVIATEKFGDGKPHLLIAMLNEKTLTARIIDCTFLPPKGWKLAELSQWKIKKVPTQQQVGMHLLLGDVNGDGRDEIVAEDFLLLRTKHGWTVKPLEIVEGQTSGTIVSHYPKVLEDGRLWFVREFYSWSKTPQGYRQRIKPFAELGTFDSQGNWQPLGQLRNDFGYGQPYPCIGDLNDDQRPELLSFEGLLWAKPVLYHLSSKGQWRKVDLVGNSLGRQLEAFLRGADPGINFIPLPLVRWEGKLWFVIVWSDGFVQAVTLRR